MNLDKKLELAHEWFMLNLRRNGHALAVDAWRYADAMEAEYKKREELERKEKREKVRALLNDDNTFIEREGEHFDDLNSTNSSQLDWQPDLNIKESKEVAFSRGVIRITESQDQYWQPDWSVAPETAIEWFMIDDGRFTWKLLEDGKIWYTKAPSFNYQGDWKQSLRKRPEL